METQPVRRTGNGILTGSFSAMGLGILLNALGIAIALSAPSAAGGWLAVWSLVVPIVALFFGGLVGGRAGPVISRAHAFAYGIATWGFTYVVGGALSVMGIRALAGVGGARGLGRLLGNVVGGAGINLSNSALYAWFFTASVFLALIGACLGFSLGYARQVHAVQKLPAGIPSERVVVQ